MARRMCVLVSVGVEERVRKEVSYLGFGVVREGRGRIEENVYDEKQRPAWLQLSPAA